MRRIAFIGAGRLGQTLAGALAAAGENVVAVVGRAEGAAAAAVAAAELVFLTVPDDAIEALARALPWRAGQAVVHCSGATELTALAAAAAAGAWVGGFHPLQIFSDPATAAGLLAGSAVAIEAEAPLLERLHELAVLLQMTPLHLPPGGRAAYHAGAGFAASFLLSMLDEAVQLWAGIGIAEPQALQALLPLARGTLQAAQVRGLAGALAGPISRGDAGVVAAHLRALDGLDAAHGEFYRLLCLRQLSLAERSGRLDQPALRRLEALLRRAAE